MKFRNYGRYEVDVENGKIINYYGWEIGSKHKNGYVVVALRRQGVVKKYYLHRVIWETVYGSIPTGFDVHHINGDKTDNRISNLELINWYKHINNHTNNNDVNELNDRKRSVIQMTMDGTLVAEYPSLYATQKNGFVCSCVSRCCNGITSKYRGFLWKWKEN